LGETSLIARFIFALNSFDIEEFEKEVQMAKFS
jgi:hypothetical protein